MSRQSRNHNQRALGAYYTSAVVADLLCKWAIRSEADIVLEPSFGGCEFISAIFRRLTSLGSQVAMKQIMGVDVDPAAFQALESRGYIADQSRFKNDDFLSLPVDAFDTSGFDVVIGNPPYVRHHAFSEQIRSNAKHVNELSGIGMPMRANLWAFFLLHATRFLKPGGRVAFVLPQNFLYATYAERIRSYIARHFSNVTVLLIQEHLFKDEGASEKTVFLLADDWQSTELSKPSDLSIYAVDDMAAVDAILSGAVEPSKHVRSAGGSGIELDRTRNLGDLCRIRIGLVTGKSDFFLFNAEKSDQTGIDEQYLLPILSKSDQVIGLNISEDDLLRAFSSGARTAILDTRKNETEHKEAVKSYLETLSEEDIQKNKTFKKRPIWHQPFDDLIGDAFFTGMSHLFPRMALNTDRVNCTNTLYRVFFEQDAVRSKKQIILSLVSSFGQLSAELQGRPYGSGLLKLEPSDAKAIRVFIDGPDNELVNSVFERVDALLKQGRQACATQVVDRFHISRGFISESALLSIRADLNASRRSRLRKFSIQK